ncbi:hypothetical protein ACB098_12G104700 [Castanea mollissima]
MGLRFTQSVFNDGGSCCCWFWLVVASVGAELLWDSCSELLRCDFVGFLGGFSWVGDGLEIEEKGIKKEDKKREF